MEDHFDRTIRFNDQSELKNLYLWSINEHNEAGEKVGRDYIPWEWTLYFRAKNVTLNDNTKIGDRYAREGDAPGAKVRRFIAADLNPDETGRYAPRYSMFGTDRTISEFNLFIEEADAKGDRCHVWGGVSYTTDIDFRDVTQPDTLTFYFYVSRERFDQYAARIAAGDVDSLVARFGNVAGFYADWSPGITTDKIKVLTRDKKHEVQGTKEDIPLARLGEVEEAELFLARKLDLPIPPDPYADDATDDADATHEDGRPVDRAAQLEAVRDSRGQETLKMITSLRMAAWVIAVLLLIKLFV